MITRYLGFRHQHDEYKVMGLAAYGGTSMAAAVDRLAAMDETTGSVRLDLRYFDHHRRPSRARSLFSDALVGLLGPPRAPKSDLTDRHRDIARGTQLLTERLVLGYVHFAGPGLDTDEVERRIGELPAGHRPRKLDRPHTRAAELLRQGKIIGWCRGPMEFALVPWAIAASWRTRPE